MESTINFRDLLKLNSRSVQRPRSAPECWLLGTISAMEQKVLPKGTGLIVFDLIDIEGHPDNEEGLLDNINLNKLRSPFANKLIANFWITSDAIYHLTNMLDNCVGDEDRPIEERLPETKGLRVMFKVRPVYEPDPSGNQKETGQNEVDSRTMRLAAARDEDMAAE